MAKQLQEVQAEREELMIAERVLNRLAEQDRAAAEAAVPSPARVAGRAVLLIPHRGENPDEAALPADYRKILRSFGPPMVRCRSGRWARSWGWRWGCAGSGAAAGEDDQAR